MTAYRGVYSTGSGNRCDRCGRPATACICKADTNRPGARAETSRPAADGVVRIRLEKKGRGGKTVTTIAGLALAEPELRALATELKKSCGSGGSVKDGIIEIQGDHRQRLVADLARRGYAAKLAGG